MVVRRCVAHQVCSTCLPVNPSCGVGAQCSAGSVGLQVDIRDQALVGMVGQAAARWGRAMCSRRGGRTTSSTRLSLWPGVPTGVLSWGPATRCCSSLLQFDRQPADTAELLSAVDGPWAAEVTVHDPCRQQSTVDRGQPGSSCPQSFLTTRFSK